MRIQLDDTKVNNPRQSAILTVRKSVRTLGQKFYAISRFGIQKNLKNRCKPVCLLGLWIGLMREKRYNVDC